MEFVSHHKVFKTPPIPDLSIINENQYEPPTATVPYAEIMLCEYYHLVNSLTKLSESQLQSIQIEVDKTISKLTKWLDKMNSINPIELFSAMRHLKHKANTLTKQTI